METSLVSNRCVAGVEITIFKPVGMMNIATCNDIKDRLVAFMENGQKYFLFDMSEVEFLDSLGLSTLVLLHKELESSGGLLLISGMKPQIRMIFQITNVDKKLNIFDSSEEAFKFLENK